MNGLLCRGLVRTPPRPRILWEARAVCLSKSIRPNVFGKTLKRPFSQSCLRKHEALVAPKAGEELYCTFITKEGKRHTYAVAEGDNLLDIALENDLEMEGACGGSCACSTCHVIVDEGFYDKLDQPSDDEEDMLDLAFGLTETSRLGCQIHMTKDIDGIVVQLPRATRNLTKEDFKAS